MFKPYTLNPVIKGSVRLHLAGHAGRHHSESVLEVAQAHLWGSRHRLRP